jgi:glutamine synthetase
LQKADLKKYIRKVGLDLLGVSYVDLAGVARMKPALVEELDSFLKNGVKTSRGNLAMTSYDHLVHGSSLNISQGDLAIVPDFQTFVIPSYTPNVGRFIGNLYEKDGSVSPVCSRSFFSRVMQEALVKDYEFEAGFEAEFHLVKRENNTLAPSDYSITHSQDGFNFHSKIIEEMIDALKSVKIDLEKVHIEGGHGQLEFDIKHHKGLKPADDIVYFKDAVKAIARNHGYIASFMPKIGDGWWGTGMHLHMSLWDKSGRKNLFSDANDELGLTELAYYFIGGLLDHLPALTAIACPSVNSYKRLLQGKWNADAQVYGAGVRGAAIRIPDERGEATRLECRFPDGACNPYLTMGSLLACGLDGIERKLDPGDPLRFDLSFLSDREIKEKGFLLMPRSLREAVVALEKDKFLRSEMGDLLFDEFVKNREYDISQAADKVTQWEVDRFLDIY